MNALPNLDHLDDLDRGVEPEPEPTKPSDTITAARCLLDLQPGAGVVSLAARATPPAAGDANETMPALAGQTEPYDS